MGSYGSGRKATYHLTTQYHKINVESARVFGYRIVYTEQKNVKGLRPWIICPFCQRRCSKLYFWLKSPPMCRKCLHLNYPSQRQSDIEKQRTYERYILEQGWYEEWRRLPKRYLSFEEAKYHYDKWNIKMMRELFKLQIETMRCLQMMFPVEKRVVIEQKILLFEGKKEVTSEDIEMATHEIEELRELIAA